MNVIWFATGAVLGMVAGGLLVYLATRGHRGDMEKSFSALSQDVLRRNSEDFLQLAESRLSQQARTTTTELDGKKALIDQSLTSMNGELQKVKQCITDFDLKGQHTFGQVSEQLRTTTEKTKELQDTTFKLKEALGNTKVRGQWGERMAEDILRLAGFVEGINYLKQKTQETVASRPDYTFLLPQERRLNMDVKFPWNSYQLYAAEESEDKREAYKAQFLRDVRQRIKEVTTRDYINPQEKTLDYVLVFVPNEQVYGFIMEHDRDIVDDSLKSRVVLCSPFTLYANLCVIRQALDNFSLNKATSQMQAHFGEFEKQWHSFKESMDKVGKRLDDATREFQSLVSTRVNQLERPLSHIRELRTQQGGAEAGVPLDLLAQSDENGKPPAEI
jgi:DNA recombination protein RmuC